eukprot:Clim_evm24s14 gene=Clim_evmTU24s14
MPDAGTYYQVHPKKTPNAEGFLDVLDSKGTLAMFDLLLTYAVCQWGLVVGFLGGVAKTLRTKYHQMRATLSGEPTPPPTANLRYEELEFENIDSKLEKGLISVIVPCVNESEGILKTLRYIAENAHTPSKVEIIVVDGQSSDDTVTKVEIYWGQQLASKDSALKASQLHSIRVVSATRGRAVQQNMGATLAQGEILQFCHADTRLPPGWDQLVREHLPESAPQIFGGAFELWVDTDNPSIHCICEAANARARMYKLPYGDQAIFARALAFRKVGGFPSQIFMEDYEFVRQLVAAGGELVLIPQPVLTSPRRWLHNGPAWNTFLNQIFVICYSILGFDAQTIHKWYYRSAQLYTWNTPAAKED